jgi:hypothetical protein
MKIWKRPILRKKIGEILAGLSEDYEGSDDFDIDSGADHAEDRPWRPSHVVFGKSTVKKDKLRQ